MLQHLSVNNYALINNVEVDFENGLTIITGETGAGKSILLGALGLLLGQRAESQILWDKEKKCIIEGHFEINKLGLDDFFNTNELDYDNTLIIRREVAANGKSRAFINDTPVTLQQLKEIGTYLIDIHSQHETLNLQNSNFQTSLLDHISGTTKSQKDYKTLYISYKNLQSELVQLEEESFKSKAEVDYLTFLLNELDELKIKSNEDTLLEQELEILTHSTEIANGIQKATRITNSEELSLLSLIKEQRQIINSLEKYNPEFVAISSRIKSCEIELRDITNELETIESKLSFDPERITQLNARLDKIYTIFQKHRVNSADELLAKQEELNNKLGSLEFMDNQVIETKKQLSEIESQLQKIATEMSSSRKKSVAKFDLSVQSILKDLSMPDSVFKTEIETNSTLSTYGYDKINFLFSANKGHQAGEISKVASGGELSRLMLALKSLVTEQNILPTIIFDEIDTGVSGNVAAKVASVLNNLAESKQVIVITHLPQIAAKGRSHFFVYKDQSNKVAHSNIKKLNNEERLIEIGKMLSSDKLTDAALKQAQELINEN